MAVIRKLLRIPARFIRAIRYGLHLLTNRWRGRHRHLDYIAFSLPAQLPALPERRGWLRRRILGDAPFSLLDLDRAFRQIGADPRPQGVILYLSGFDMTLADLQTLRDSIIRLRRAGKRVICFAQGYDTSTYYVASAADEIMLQPGGELLTLGLLARPAFLRDALDAVGVQLDSVAITPFKGALDSLTRQTISPEGQQQLEWLLDSRYTLLLTGIAEGRRMTGDEARALIDGAPHLDDAALAAGYVDHVLTEEGLARHLGAARIVPWEEASRRLRRIWRGDSRGRYVAVLPAVGLMIPGESSTPPGDRPIQLLGDARLGDRTLVRAVRALMRDQRAAAVVLWIDSGGGSATAAEAMTSALAELGRDRPLIACMNGVAASGGYYIATAARHIVAQPGTITGSIGVIGAKPVTGGLFDRLHINRLSFARGANADFLSDEAPFTDAQRARFRALIEHTYAQFIGRVAQARGLSVEAVDTVGGGRVWTGAQALDHGLVDELGDLHAALAQARALANLPDDAPTILWAGGGKAKPIAPQLAPDPAALLGYLRDNLRHVAGGRAQMLLPFKWE